MNETDTMDEALALRLGVDRSTVSRIRRGRRMPSPEMMRLIHAATDGAVTANDFVHSAPEAPQAEPESAKTAA